MTNEPTNGSIDEPGTPEAKPTGAEPGYPTNQPYGTGWQQPQAAQSAQPQASQPPHGYGPAHSSAPGAYFPSGQPTAGQPTAGQPTAGQPTGYPDEGYPQQGYPQQGYPQQGYPQQGYAYGGPNYNPAGYSQPPNWWAPPPVAGHGSPYAPTKPGRRKLVMGSVAAGAAVILVAGGVAVALDHSRGGSSQQTAVQQPNSTDPFGSGNGQTTPQYGFGDGFGSDGSNGGSSGSGSNGSGSGSTGTTGTATSTQQVGVVDINTVLDYGTGKAAGTGMVLTAGGEILTNNHVVEDSTSLSVVVVSTGKTYTGTVVGTDPTDDIAIVQLKDASGLATAKLGDSSGVAVGNAVTAVGNAGGTGGAPSSATGSVTALNQSITASDGNGSNAEKLTEMIQVNAAIQAGDSGGPLYNSSGSIVGIDTAASSSRSSSATVGFAIPINKALTIAKQIESGTDNTTIHQGYPAFLGVELQPAGQSSAAGATISGILKNSGAAGAGLVAGDTITAVNGKQVASANALSTIMGTLNPGQQVKLSWTDSAGKAHTGNVTLGSGPAD